MLGRLSGGLVGAAYGSIESVSADMVGSGTKGTGVAAKGARHGGTALGIRVPTNAMAPPNPEPSRTCRTRRMLSA